MSVDVIMNLGSDQLANQFQLKFPNGIPGGGSGENIALRMDQSFDPPEEATGEYEVFYRGVKIMFSNMLDETDKHVTFDVRLDSQWAIFDDLKSWKEMVFNANTGTAQPQENVRTTLLMEYLNTEGSIAKMCRFSGAILKTIKVQTSEHGSGDPLRLTLNFMYNKMTWE